MVGAFPWVVVPFPIVSGVPPPPPPAPPPPVNWLLMLPLLQILLYRSGVAVIMAASSNSVRSSVHRSRPKSGGMYDSIR
uniref:Putative secreted protein n=1 Tax=Anopheles marajoara TaxID=58244 RepID=A0A2M4CC48_9DIPT